MNNRKQTGMLGRLLRCRSAAIAPLTAMLIVPIAGAAAFAVELGSWQYMQRAAQNAADGAAIASATVASGAATTGTTSQMEARAAAKELGFANGGDIAVTSGTTACPTGVIAGSTCYEAVVTTSMPFAFARLVGYTGTGGSGSQQIAARAVAVASGGGGGSATSACVWAFNHLQTNGTPNANLAGCSVLAGGSMTCTGQGVHADFAVAGSTITGNCANVSPGNNKPNQTIPTDPYAALASNIPTAACNNPAKTGNLSGTLLIYCGNTTLTGNVTLTSPNTVVVIRNGTLDLNDKVFKTASGASATIIFDGAAPPFGDKNMKGTIDIQAPSSTSTSAWKGVAIYRNPNATGSVDVTLAGSKATWMITGLVYFPKTNVTLDGAVNHSSTGATCFVLVATDITVNGNGQILQTTTGCSTAGLTPPSLVVGGGPVTPIKLVL